MNLKRLQTFIQVVDRRSFSEVAEILDLTQSGVSRQIKTLEEEVGIQLLNRNSSFVELTPAGRLVYKKAKLLLAQWDELLQECQALKNVLNGILKIGASTIPATYLLPKIVKSFHEKHPKVEFCIVTDDSGEILTKLENQQIDAAIVGRSPDPARFQSQIIAEDRLVLIGNDPECCISSLEEIKKYPLILRERGSGTREAMEQALQRYGIALDDLRYVAEVGSTEAVLAMVEAGVGLSFVSYWALRETGRKNISVLYELPTERRFYLAMLTARLSHPVIRAFAEEAQRVYAKE
ncbi:selenium metabolism-associated LysR family transcriptional regulator [Bacillaceae bacterium]